MGRNDPGSSRWERKKTQETRVIEAKLREFFPKTDAYRFNSASIRIRVVDERFEGKSRDERVEMLDRLLEQFPEDTQADVIFLVLLTPGEFEKKESHYLMKAEFEDPHPTRL